MGPIIMNGGYHPPTLLCEVGVVLKVRTHLLLVGSKIPDCDRIPCCPPPGTNFGTPGCSTHRPPRNSCVLWLGLAVQRCLVKVLTMMVQFPEKRGPIVRFWHGEKFLPAGRCLPRPTELPIRQAPPARQELLARPKLHDRPALLRKPDYHRQHLHRTPLHSQTQPQHT